MKKRIISILLVMCITVTLLPTAAFAAGSDPDNNVAGPVEKWVYDPYADPIIESLPWDSPIYDNSNTLRVRVTATDRITHEEVPVEDATVHLYVGSEWRKDAVTGSDGYATISLWDLSESEKMNATVSADKIVSRGKAIGGTARDPLFSSFPKDDNGDYYRYTMELHSEWIDTNGNWCGTPLPEQFSSDKVDIAFAIDATGSMYDDINNVRTNLAEFSKRLLYKGIDARFCIIEYRDVTENEPAVLHTVSGSHWLTDIVSVVSELASIEVHGGGDAPETPIDALSMIADNKVMHWRDDANRFVFLLTDAGYYNENGYGYSDLSDIAGTLANLDFVTSVITSSSLERTYATLCNATGGINADINTDNFNIYMSAFADRSINSGYMKVNLHLSEPRLLVNMSVCYFADDKRSMSESYKSSVKNMLNEYAKRFAETTDGHVLIDKILLFSTSNRLDFYDTGKKASMADIRIESEVNDDGVLWNTVKIHSNAHIGGFYTDKTFKLNLDKETEIQTVEDFFKYGHFAYLKNLELYAGRESFARIQLGGVAYSWDHSLIDNVYQYSTTVAHESGHYLFAFFDEYLNASGEKWRKAGGRPYPCYGLMDNEHADIEMSKTAIDYVYIGDFDTAPNSKHTSHSVYYKGSCEDMLAYWLTDTSKDRVRERISSTDYDAGPYESHYTKVKESSNILGSHDRLAAYPYASLSEDDFLPVYGSGRAVRALLSGIRSAVSASVPATFFDDFTATGDSLGAAEMKGSGSKVAFSLAPLDDYDYSLYLLKSGAEEYSGIGLTEKNGKYTAELPVDLGEIAEIRLVAEKDGETFYNRYFIDRSNEVDVGYIYASADNAVNAYVNAAGTSSYTFVADNTVYTNGDYVSVNQATAISGDDGVAFTGGEIYSVADFKAEIDYRTLSWFRYKDGVWTKLDTDHSEEENKNIGARADLDGDGLYVLMAKKASVDKTVYPASDISFTQSADRDAVVTLTFNDPNPDSKYYNVYYADYRFGNKNAEDVICASFRADSDDLTLNLLWRDRTVYAAIEIVSEDGSRSELSPFITLEASAADRDGDGIPDWYCDKYLLWGKDGEEKNIADSDDDGDGYTNLQEYRIGSNPASSGSPGYILDMVSFDTDTLNMRIGEAKTLTTTVISSSAEEKILEWSVSDDRVLSVTPNGEIAEIRALAEGTATVTAVLVDGGYPAICTVTVTADHVHSYTAVVTDPSCTERGYTTHICSCGNSYKDSYTAALGHDWGNGIVTKAPTETSTGVRTYYCSRCTATRTEMIPALEHIHDYGEPVYEWNNDFTACVGKRFCRSEKCGECFTENAAVTEKITKTPTCELAGERYILAVFTCKAFYSQELTFAIPALGHDYINGKCSRCGALRNPFTDIGSCSKSFQTAIIWANANGIASGTSATTYSPNGSCTRGQVVAFLWRAAGRPEPTTTDNPYNDVKSSAYYYKAILWAAENGITAGYNNADGSKSFKPGDTVTRGQFVTFLWRYLGKPAPSTTVNPFNDVKGGGFYKAILWGSENGIVAGYKNADGSMSFKPNNPCTRAHVAVFLYRAMGK